MSKQKLQNTIICENGVAAVCLNVERAKAATMRPLKAKHAQMLPICNRTRERGRDGVHEWGE